MSRGGESPTAQCTITTTADPNRFQVQGTVMRAFVIRGGFGFENLAHEDRPDPVPGPGQVLVRVRAASLNYRDLLVARTRTSTCPGPGTGSGRSSCARWSNPNPPRITNARIGIPRS